MLKRDFFLMALNANMFLSRNWVIECFCLTKNNQDNKLYFPFQVIRLPDAYYFAKPPEGFKAMSGEELNSLITNPTLTEKDLVKLSDGDISKPLLSKDENIILSVGEVPNVKVVTKTIYGNLFVNYYVFVYSVYDKIEFKTGKISVKDIEDFILPLLTDDLKEGEENKKDCIYVSEYLKIIGSILDLCKFSNIFFQPGNEKTMLGSIEMKKKRDELYEKHKDKLHDPETLAMIAAECAELDKKFVNTDRVNRDFYQGSGKSFGVVRAKKFTSVGAETGLSSDTRNLKLIPNSLEEGWSKENMIDMANNARAGTYGRGKETQLGGSSVKELLRASNNINVTVDDCGTKLGVEVILTKDNVSRYIGYSIMVDGSPVLLDKDNANLYLNKKWIRRSPQYCKLSKTDFCKHCIGLKLTNNPNGVSVAISEYGSRFLYLFMAAIHGKALSVAEVDLNDVIY